MIEYCGTIITMSIIIGVIAIILVFYFFDNDEWMAGFICLAIFLICIFTVCFTLESVNNASRESKVKKTIIVPNP